MAPEERIRKVAELRHQTLRGTLIHFTPMQPEDTAAVLALRNSARAIFALAQGGALTPELHKNWYHDYLERDDDLAWMIRTPGGDVIGTISLYKIDAAGRVAEKGRLVIDEVAACRAPYAIETDLLVLSLAFDALDVARVVASVRPDNTKVVSFHRRVGFRFSHDIMLKATPYQLYVLDRADFARDSLERVVRHWGNKVECTAG